LLTFNKLPPCSGGTFDWDQSQKDLQKLNQEAEDPNLWSDQARAQQVMRDREQLKSSIDRIVSLESDLAEGRAYLDLGEEVQDEETLQQGEKLLKDLLKKAERWRLESLLSGEADANDCFLEIHAGAGGTEAQDWALMLQRMYLRWSERHGYKIEWMEEVGGEEAGIKSSTFKIMGHQAYGWLKTEAGVHRLVRISPFDANARRHTSFASVWVYPSIDDSIDIQIDEKDLRIDTYRSSGAGGQHVNKTESAVRITHLPTNIVVQCQNDRSQHRNKAQAMAMLKARLYEQELKKREEEAQLQASAKTDIGWGHQIRSYVLQPYQMVKDLRTGVEIGNPHAVLDGDIDEFLEAALAGKIRK
jgi:peptide chain release factor 2